MASLVMVGSVAYDSVEAPAGSVTRALGGAATYASVAASFFVKPRIVGVVGDDFEPAHVEFLASRGIDLEGLQHEPGKTFHWSGVYSENLNERTTRSTELNVFEQFNPILPEAWRSSDYVLLANIHPQLQLSVLDQMTAPKFVALDTMNLWIDIAREPLAEVIARVQLLVINDEEAELLTGIHHPLEAARQLLALGPQVVIIKKGEHGATMFTAGGMFVLPAYPVETVKDPTGCGDCFAGGFLGFLAEADDLSDEVLRRAMVYGTVVASYNVEEFSLDRLRTLRRADLDSRLAEFRRLTAF